MWLSLIRPLLGIWPATQACALTGNWTGDPLVLRPALNPLSHTSQGQKSLYTIIGTWLSQKSLWSKKCRWLLLLLFVNQSKLYQFFVRSAKKYIVCVSQNFSNEFMCSMRWRRLKIAGTEFLFSLKNSLNCPLRTLLHPLPRGSAGWDHLLLQWGRWEWRSQLTGTERSHREFLECLCSLPLGNLPFFLQYKLLFSIRPWAVARVQGCG